MRRKLIEVWAADMKTRAFRTLDEAFGYAEQNGYRRAFFHGLHLDGVLAYRAINPSPEPPTHWYLYFREY